MSANASIQVVGVKDTLRELGKIEPELKKQITKDVKTILRPVVDEAKRAMPQMPLSGFARPWKRGVLFPYEQATVQRSISARLNTRKRGNALAVIAVVMKSPAGTIFDMAGRKGGKTPQGKAMIQALEHRFGRASRGMWPAYERNATAVNKAMEDVVGVIVEATNRRLVA